MAAGLPPGRPPARTVQEDGAHEGERGDAQDDQERDGVEGEVPAVRADGRAAEEAFAAALRVQGAAVAL